MLELALRSAFEPLLETAAYHAQRWAPVRTVELTGAEGDDAAPAAKRARPSSRNRGFAAVAATAEQTVAASWLGADPRPPACSACNWLTR